MDTAAHAIRERALELSRRIVLVDGEDERVLEASLYVREHGSLELVLLGNETTIWERLRSMDPGVDLEVIDPEESPLVEEFAALYREKMVSRRRAVSAELAAERAKDPSYFAAMLLETGKVDGLVGGAALPTAKILKAALEVVGLSEVSGIVSGSFGMFLPRALPSGQNFLLFSDCAVVPDPDAEQLAAIAANAVRVMERVMGAEPVVAFLSFSTRGSAGHRMVDKVVRAREILEQRLPGVVVDGELQADAALIPEIAAKKAPEGAARGRSNILIFPDLNAGNIAYKLVERLVPAEALGVILEGFNKPVNDLSRGCTTAGVIDMICVTALQRALDPSMEKPTARDGGASG